MAKKLSVFIIAQNEADRIGVTIASVKGWADEVIVIDSGSTDNTVALCDSLGAKVYPHTWQGYGLQKRFGEDQCRNDWLLNLDADEEISPKLAQEIQTLLQGEPAASGYVIKIRDMLPGETMLAPLAHTNFAIRLYDRRKARFSDSPVHDTVIIHEGEKVMLEHPAYHRSFRSLSHAIEKMDFYTGMQAQNLLKKGLKYPTLRLITEFPIAFFKDYILRGYILRGRRGFVYATLYAFTRFVRIAKYMEIKKIC